MKKNILLILVLILISSTSITFANNSDVSSDWSLGDAIVDSITKPYEIIAESKEHIDIGSYDIWLHADGVTWQKNIKPGSTINHNPTIKIPVDDSKNPKNFKVEFLSNPYDVPNDYRKYSVNSGNIVDFEYLGNGQLSFKLNTKLVSHGNDGRGFDVKEYEWQAGAVEGWRFYIPVKITWEQDEEISGGGIGFIPSIGSPFHKVSHFIINGDEFYYVYAKYEGTEYKFYDREEAYKKVNELDEIYKEEIRKNYEETQEKYNK